MTFRILSLDGGGAWCLVQAMALADLFPERGGHAILRRFDLAVASGGGALVLGALMADRSPAQIVEALRARATLAGLFRPRRVGGVERLVSRFGLYPRFQTSAKPAAIAGLLGPKGQDRLDAWTLDGPGEAPVGVLFLAYDQDRRSVAPLRSYAVETTAEEGDTLTIADAVHAATTAPFSYHDAPAEVGGRRFWDASLAGCHNPLMTGVVDAMAMGAMAEDIVALSLGAGRVRLAPGDLVTGGDGTAAALVAGGSSVGPKAQVDRAAEAVQDGPGDSACWTAHVTLTNDPGEMGRVVRMSPLAQPVPRTGGGWAYPKAVPAALFDALARLDRAASGAGEIDLIAQLGEAWIKQGAANQPIRAGADLSIVLGDATYAAAKRRWRSQ